LFGEIRVKSLVWQQAELQARIDGGRLQLLPACFFSLNVCIESLEAKAVTIRLAAEPTQSEPKQAPVLTDIKLPFEVLLARLSIQALQVYREQAQLLQVENIRLKTLLLQQSKVSVAKLEASSFGETAELKGAVTLTGAYPVKAHIALKPASLSAWLAANQLSTDATAENQLNLDIGGSLQSLTLAANLQGQLDIQLSAAIALLDPLLPYTANLHHQRTLNAQIGEYHAALAETRLAVQGNLQSVDVQLSGSTQLPYYPQSSEFDLQGSSDYQLLNIKHFKLNNPEAVVAVSGQLYRDDRDSVLNIGLEKINPAVFAPQYPGELNLQAQLTLQSLLATPVIKLVITAIDGQFLDRPVLAAGLLQWRSRLGSGSGSTAGVDFQQWQLSSGEDHIFVDGRFPEQTIQWRANINNLQHYLADAKGKLTASGTLAGSLARADINATINGERLTYGDYQLSRLSSKLAIKQLGWQNSRLSITAEGLSTTASEQSLAIDLTLSGKQHGSSSGSASIASANTNKQSLLAKLASLTLEARVQQGEYWQSNVNCSAELTLADVSVSTNCPQLTIAINEPLLLQSLPNRRITTQSTAKAVVERGDWSRWKNDQPLQFSWDAGSKSYHFGDVCLRNAEAAICLANAKPASNATSNPAGRTLLMTASNLPLAWGHGFLAESYDLQGMWGFDARLQQAAATTVQPGPSSWQLQGQLATSGLSITTGSADAGTITLPVEQLKLVFDANSEAFKADVKLISASLGDVTATLNYQQQQLTGQLQLDKFLLQPVAGLFVDLKQLSGELSTDIQFSVIDSHVELQGGATLSGLAVNSRSLPLALSEGKLAIQFNRRSLTVAGDVLAGDGPTRISGDADWSTDDWKLSLALQANDIRLEPLPHSYAKVTAAIDLLAEPGRIDISGEITVPEAKIELEKLPQNAVTVSDDSIIEDQQNNGSSFKVFANINTVLGKDISFRGFGLETKLRGQLNILQQPGQSTTGNGVVNLIDGRYRAYGQDLLIEEGRMIFAGPLTNPELYVTAIRNHTEEGVRVGVQASGSAREAKLTLFSTPSMSEQNVLYYLLTGKAPGESGNVDQSRLAEQTAIALGMAQSNKKARQIGESIGISDFQMGTDTGKNGEEAQFSGYITPDLYLLYGVSLFDQLSSITARYELTRDIYLEVYNSTSSAIDIFWSFTKD
jgi:translocation and assembly module TamB